MSTETVKATSPFHVGQRVTMRAYTDCFGKHHEAIKGMRVERVQLLRPTRDRPYVIEHYRIVATKDGGRIRYVESAARSFDAE